MSDDTTVAPSGNLIRTKERTPGGPKTQVFQWDVSPTGTERLFDADTMELPVSLASIIDVNISSMPGAGPTTDWLAASLDTSKIANGLVQLTPKFKFISVAAAQTDTSVIAAVTAKKLRPLVVAVQVGGTATDVTFESDDPSADTVLWKLTPGINGGMVLGFSPVGLFETDAGEGLIVTTGAGATAQILIVYLEV